MINIDWSKMITVAMKDQQATEQLLANVQAETARLRAIADTTIAPLQDAVELDEATETEAAMLREWKRYRIALNRITDQAGYPSDIEWPLQPVDGRSL